MNVNSVTGPSFIHIYSKYMIERTLGENHMNVHSVVRALDVTGPFKDMEKLTLKKKPRNLDSEQKFLGFPVSFLCLKVTPGKKFWCYKTSGGGGFNRRLTEERPISNNQ